MSNSGSTPYGPESSRVYLIGFRGSGKTTVARELARVLGWELFDTDAAIEARTQKSIAEIFATDGEGVFRDLEKQVLAESAARPGSMLVSTGGGIVLLRENLELMKSTGILIWLEASWEEIERRLRADPTTEEARPVLTGAEDALSEVRVLVEQRNPIYEEWATLRVRTDARTIPDIITGIMEHLGGRK